LEQALEITNSESVVVVSLNELEEDGGSIHNGFREQLEQISLVVIVDQDFQSFDFVDVFLDFDGHVREVLPQVGVVGLRNLEEVDPSVSEGVDGGKEVIGVEGDVLDSGSGIVVDVLLDLASLLAGGRLVVGHLAHSRRSRP
jgi:hypothetical protein